MYLFLKVTKFLCFLSLNILLLFISTEIDIEQFLMDLDLFFEISEIEDMSIFVIISMFVVFTTFVIKQLLRPFVEIFIYHYFKFGFYFLINILSISATYIVLRVYGYSRLYLLIYLFVSSLAFELFDRVEKKFN